MLRKTDKLALGIAEEERNLYQYEKLTSVVVRFAMYPSWNIYIYSIRKLSIFGYFQQLVLNLYIKGIEVKNLEEY